MNKINPIPYFSNPIDGRPLSGGKLYIGNPDTDPAIPVNQKQVYALQENGNTVSIPQPIILSVGGTPVYNGTGVSLYVSGDYSLKVLTSTGVQRFYIPDSSVDLSNEEGVYDTVADMTAATPSLGGLYKTKGYYSIGDGGAAEYLIIAGNSGDGYGSHNIGANTAELQGELNLKKFGCVLDGVADDYAALVAALTKHSNTGKRLTLSRGICRIETAIDITLTRVWMYSEGLTILLDTAGDVIFGVRLTVGAGLDHQILGEGLTVDSNGKAHIGFQILQVGAPAGTKLLGEKLGVTNVEMQVGAGTGSSGLSVRGGFEIVTLVDPVVENVMMRTGAGVIGSRGVTGILVVNNFPDAAAYCLNTVLIRPKVSRVYSEAPDYQYDMDGIGIFANPSLQYTEGTSYASIESPDIRGCWGRNIKTQTYSATITSPKGVLDEGPTGGIINPTYDFQTGPGTLVGGHTIIDGVVVSAPLVRMAGTYAGIPIASKWVGGSIEILNGGYLNDAITFDHLIPEKAVVSVEGVSVKGEIRDFALLRTNGFDIHEMRLEGITVTALTEALVRVISGGGGVAPYRAVAHVSGCVNSGTEKPTVYCNVPGLGAGCLLNEEACIGFGPVSTTLTSTAQLISGVAVTTSAKIPKPLTSGLNAGSEKLYSFALAGGAEITLPGHGFNNNYMAEIIMGVGRTTYATVTVDTGGITNISVGAGASIGTTSDPGSGTLRIWRLTATNQLVIKNGDASTRIFTIRYIG